MGGVIPVSDRHRPFPRDFSQVIIGRFNCRLIVWKAVSDSS